MSEDLRTKEFLALYTSCQRQLYVYVRCHVPNAQDADDVLQDISGVLWEKFGQFRREEDFARWACGVARLEVLKYRQQNKRARTVGLKEDFADRVLEDILRASTDANTLYEAMTSVPGEDFGMGTLGPEVALRVWQERGGHCERFGLHGGGGVQDASADSRRPV